MSFQTGSISLSSGVSGVLPIANGGTGVSTPSFAFAHLAADATAIQSSTSLANIPGLSFTMAAGEIWEFELDVFLTMASTTMQARVSINGSTAASTVTFTGEAVDGSAYIFQQNAGVPRTAYDQFLQLGDTANSRRARLRGRIVNGAASSILSARLCQAVSEAADLIAKAGSTLLAWRKDS